MAALMLQSAAEAETSEDPRMMGEVGNATSMEEARAARCALSSKDLYT